MSNQTDFGARVRIGAIWAYGAQMFVTLLTFVVGVIMARLLGPADFGLFIAVTAFTSMGLVVVQVGMPPALIQARTLDDAQKNAAFWLVLLVGVVFFGLAMIVATPLSRVYQSAQFSAVMLSLAASFLLTAHSSVGLALLRRNMAFDTVARINAAAHTSAAALSVAAALLGLGVYSLVLGALVAMLGTSIGIIRAGVWRPTWPALRPVLTLLHYAWFSLINSAQNMAINRADNMIVGALLGTLSLGLYNRAFSLARLPSEQFADSLGPVLLGALSRIQTDADWSRRMFFKAISAISTLTLPFLALLMVGGPTFVLLVYGEEWIGAGAPLQVMVLGGYFVLLTSLQTRLAYAQGLVKEAAWAHFGVLAATVALTFVAVPFGLLAVAGVMAVRELLWSFLMARVLARSALRVTYVETLHASLPALLAAGGSGLAAAWWAMDAKATADAVGMLVWLVKLGLFVFTVYGVLLVTIALIWRTHEPLQNTARLAWDSLIGLARRWRRSASSHRAI